MNNNTIIELREQDSLNLGSAGYFQTDLSQQLIINEGDIFQLSSAFIDTVDSSSGEIIIPEDIQLNINFTPYMTFWEDAALYKIDSNSLEPEAEPYVKNYKYILPYTRIPSEITFDYYFSDEVAGTAVIQNNSDPFVASPPFTLIFSYIDPAFQKQYLQYNIPSLNTTEFFKLNFTIITTSGSLTIEQPSQSFINQYQLFIDYQSIFQSVEASNYLHNKYLTTVIIPKGSYNPTELSLFISKKLSVNNKSAYSSNGQLIVNPFLKNLSDFETYRDPVAPFDPTTNPLNTTYFFTTDSSDALVYKTLEDPNNPNGNTFFIGTEQISLEFNTDTQKFQWTYLHSPIYDKESGKNISVRYIKSGNDIYTVGSNGGIFFNDLSAEYVSNGKPFDFWSGVLGFDVPSMLVQTSPSVIPIFESPGGIPGAFSTTSNGFLQAIMPLVEGQHITTPYIGIDSAVVKQANDTWYYMNTSAIPFDSTVDTTNSINASISLPRLLDRFSHFLIEIEAVMFNTMIGTTTTRTIKGICNKFMSYSAYTYVGQEGAIQYIHKGQSQVLKSIKVKILNPRKSNAIAGLGTDNTFYFQLVKNVT
jgi:hypothetical protein